MVGEVVNNELRSNDNLACDDYKELFITVARRRSG